MQVSDLRVLLVDRRSRPVRGESFSGAQSVEFKSSSRKAQPSMVPVSPDQLERKHKI